MRYIKSAIAFIRSRLGTCIFTVIIISVLFAILMTLLGWSRAKQEEAEVSELPYFTLKADMSFEKSMMLRKACSEISSSIDSCIASYVLQIPIAKGYSYPVLVMSGTTLDESNPFTQAMLANDHYLLSPLAYDLQRVALLDDDGSAGFMSDIDIENDEVVSVRFQDEVFRFEDPDKDQYHYPHATNYLLRSWESADVFALGNASAFELLYPSNGESMIIFTCDKKLSGSEWDRLERVAQEYAGTSWVSHQDTAVRTYIRERQVIYLYMLILLLIAFRILIYTVQIRKKEFDVYEICGENKISLFIHVFVQYLIFILMSIAIGTAMLKPVAVFIRHFDQTTVLNFDLWWKYTLNYLILATIVFLIALVLFKKGGVFGNGKHHRNKKLV